MKLILTWHLLYGITKWLIRVTSVLNAICTCANFFNLTEPHEVGITIITI